MSDDLRQPKENQNSSGNSANKNKRYWKTARVVAVFGILETVSLVLWCKSEDFEPSSAYFIRWIADCGFLSGAAYLAHKLTGKKFKRFIITAIWSAWVLMCLVLYLAKSKPVIDESKYQLLSSDGVLTVGTNLLASDGHIVPSCVLIRAINPDDSAYLLQEQIKTIFLSCGFVVVEGEPPISPLPPLLCISCRFQILFGLCQPLSKFHYLERIPQK